MEDKTIIYSVKSSKKPSSSHSQKEINSEDMDKYDVFMMNFWNIYVLIYIVYLITYLIGIHCRVISFMAIGPLSLPFIIVMTILYAAMEYSRPEAFANDEPREFRIKLTYIFFLTLFVVANIAFTFSMR